MSRFRATVREIIELSPISLPEPWSKHAKDARKIEELNAACAGLNRIIFTIEENALSWPIADWRRSVEEIERLIGHFIRKVHELKPAKPATEAIAYFRHQLNRYAQAIDVLAALFCTKSFDVEIARGAIFVGAAGSGKSHLLAATAANIVGDNGVCVLLLGHRFRNDQIWSQIIGQLGLPASVARDQLLGALDAAAASSRRRGIIVVDAVNEGTLRRLWAREFQAFAKDVLAFPNLAVVVSCRDVFVPHVLSNAARQLFPVVVVQGFSDPAEQENAARVYMDRRGIARPAVPWLAPEFVNPLFLRSCCEAIAARGGHQFPTGLIGTKQLLAFYVDSIARALAQDMDTGGDVGAACKRALVDIARRMADGRHDWVERANAAIVVKAAFVGFQSDKRDWLSALLSNGVLREDPHPDGSDNDDPLNERDDVIRFAFQRFQDHLMADALLTIVSDIRAAFAPDGAFSFLLLETRRSTLGMERIDRSAIDPGAGEIRS